MHSLNDQKKFWYTYFYSENAILNSLNQIGAQSSIKGPALHALQNYMEVLIG